MKNQKLIPKFQSSHVRNGRLIGVFCKRTVFIKGKNSVGNCRLLVVLRNGIQGESFLGVERSSFVVLWCTGMAFRARIPWGNGRLLRLLCTGIGF